MAVSGKITKHEKMPKALYSLEDDDILMVAEDLEVKLSKAQVEKIKEIAPDYIDWFGAIEAAIQEVVRKRR